jgi:hypothetical protein
MYGLAWIFDLCVRDPRRKSQRHEIELSSMRNSAYGLLDSAYGLYGKRSREPKTTLGIARQRVNIGVLKQATFGERSLCLCSWIFAVTDTVASW